MEEIARNLILSRCARPTEDLRMIRRAGFAKQRQTGEVWKKVWDDVEKINFASTPLFMLRAVK